MENFYKVLGVNKSSSGQEIRHAYQKMALQFHPDKQSSIDMVESCEKFSRISEAWRILGDDNLKKEYDAKLNIVAANNQLPINEEVMLTEMIFDMDLDEYIWTCRCGGEYTLPKEDVNDEDCVIFCDTCSLCIKVNVTSQSTDVIK